MKRHHLPGAYCCTTHTRATSSRTPAAVIECCLCYLPGVASPRRRPAASLSTSSVPNKQRGNITTRRSRRRRADQLQSRHGLCALDGKLRCHASTAESKKQPAPKKAGFSCSSYVIPSVPFNQLPRPRSRALLPDALSPSQSGPLSPSLCTLASLPVPVATR